MEEQHRRLAQRNRHPDQERYADSEPGENTDDAETAAGRSLRGGGMDVGLVRQRLFFGEFLGVMKCFLSTGLIIRLQMKPNTSSPARIYSVLS